MSGKKDQVIAVAAAMALVSILIATGCSASLPGGTSVGTGTTNVLTTVVDPDDGNTPIVDLIGQARSSVDVEVYLLSDRGVIDALVGAEKRGAAVRVMLEEHPMGGGNENATVFRRLQGAGVQVEWSNPTFKFTHEKAIVIDGRMAAIMTENLTRSAFVSNREFAIVDNDATDVAAVEGVFQADWERRQADTSASNLVVSPSNSRAKMLDLIGQAQISMDVYAEELEDQGIENALVAAAKRGVRTRVILPAPSAHERDTNAPGRAAIQRGGVDVHLLARPYIHAKIVVVDRKTAFVGSENFSATSLDHNREMGVLVANGQAVERIEGVFAQDWAR